jgi:hypothetical protein
MSPRRFIFACLVVLFAAALFTIALEHKSSMRAQGNLRALIFKRAEAAGEVQRLRRVIAENEKLESKLLQDLKAAQSGELTFDEGSNPSALSNAVRRGILAWANLRYDRLFRVLELTPGQIAKFEELTVNHQLAMHDITEAAKENGVLAAAPAVSKLLSQETEQFHSQEAELLGEAGYQQLQDDDRTSEPRSWVNSLAGNLYFSEPLSAQQEDSLVQILANLSPGYQSGSSANTKQIQDWDAAFTQAQGVLTPAQINAMKTMQETFPAGLNAVKEALALQSQ